VTGRKNIAQGERYPARHLKMEKSDGDSSVEYQKIVGPLQKVLISRFLVSSKIL
jgi:hypothetical protein